MEGQVAMETPQFYHLVQAFDFAQRSHQEPPHSPRNLPVGDSCTSAAVPWEYSRSWETSGCVYALVDSQGGRD